MAERYLTRYAFALDRCIFCGDCVEVCPHGALGETPNFELSFFNRFGEDVTLEKNDLAKGESARVSELQGKLAAWRKSIGAQMGTANPQAER